MNNVIFVKVGSHQPLGNQTRILVCNSDEVINDSEGDEELLEDSFFKLLACILIEIRHLK